MITATARLLGTITATAVIFSTQTGSCAAATAVIKDSAGLVLQTESIPSGASEDITISDSTVNVNKSNGALISAVAVKAENTASYNVSDSVAVLKDTAGSTLLTENIRATESENIIAPDGTYVVQNSLGQTQSSGSIRSGAVNFGIPAADANVTVNSAAYDTVPSDDTLNVQVKNTLGSFVGSLVAGLWQIANSQVVIKNSLNAIIATQAVAAEASADYALADVAWTNSDGSAETTPYGNAIVCDAQVKSLFSKFTWESGDDTTSTVTIDADSAGTYTSETTDGSSGTITYSLNGGAYAAFVNPTTYANGDTLAVKRTVTTALGWAKISGTYV